MNNKYANLRRISTFIFMQSLHFSLLASYDYFGQKYLLGVASNHARFMCTGFRRYRRDCGCDNFHISYGGNISSQTRYGRR